MKPLLISEWKRLWKRKTTWLMFISIPLLLLVSANFLLSQNESVPKDAAQYTVAWNFPVMGLAEMLPTAFQGFIIMISALSVTEEYRTGQMRIVLQRAYSYTAIMAAKFFAAAGTILFFFITYFILSHLLGLLLFSKPDEFTLFYQQDSATAVDGLLYNLKFYGIAFLTALSMMVIMFFIAAVSMTTTTAIGIGVGFFLFSAAYPMILSAFKKMIGDVLYWKISFTSIPTIQFEGITLMLAEKPMFLGWNFSVLSLYILIFSCFTFLISRKKDYLL